MENGHTICVTCAWRATCNKKFSMDGSTTTRCLEYTRDLALGKPAETEAGRDSDEADESGEPNRHP